MGLPFFIRTFSYSKNAIFQKNKAALRGRLAENTLSAQAIARASKNATITTSTKDLTPQNNEFFITNTLDSRRHTTQV